ncbi:hypothetical protein Tco_0317945 [Tanacetum coccineum]
MFEKEKLSGNNFNDWFARLKLVLRVEKKMHVIEQPLPPAPEAGAEPNIETQYAEFFEKRLISQEISGRAVDLEEIQEEEDTTPSKITSNIPQEVEGFEPPQEEVILIRRQDMLSFVMEAQWIGRAPKQSTKTIAMSATESNTHSCVRTDMEAVSGLEYFISGHGYFVYYAEPNIDHPADRSVSPPLRCRQPGYYDVDPPGYSDVDAPGYSDVDSPEETRFEVASSMDIIPRAPFAGSFALWCEWEKIERELENMRPSESTKVNQMFVLMNSNKIMHKYVLLKDGLAAIEKAETSKRIVELTSYKRVTAEIKALGTEKDPN